MSIRRLNKNNILFSQVINEIKPRRLPRLLDFIKENQMEEVLDVAHPQHWSNTEDKGWTPNPEASEAYAQMIPNTEQYMTDLRPMMDDKPIDLSKFHRDLTGQDPPKGPQGIGDCTSWGNGNGCNVHQACAIKTGQANYEYQEACTEAIYAIGRCEVGGQWNSYKDGAVGAWMAKGLTTFGTLSRTSQGPYNPKRAKEWGAKGLPDNLEPEAKLHIYRTSVMVTNFEQAARLIQAGIPVVVCSDQGFNDTRDQDGFLKAYKKWYHCMVFIGVRFDREGLLCLQSWGPNVPTGPRVLDQPDNSFYVDRKIVEIMLGQRDSFAYDTGFTGFKSNDSVIDYSF